MPGPCSCQSAGYCERHRMMKTGGLYDLCKSNQTYCDLWDVQIAGADKQAQDAALVQATPGASSAEWSSIPCGDIFAKVAKIVGAKKLTKWWEKRTGVPCGCQERQEKMNKACAKLGKFVSRLAAGNNFLSRSWQRIKRLVRGDGL